MLLLLLILIYIMIGYVFIKSSLDLFEKDGSLPIDSLTDEQYTLVLVLGSIFWLPLFIHVLIDSIFSGKLKEMIKEEEEKEKLNKEEKKNKK